jgi:hypothetical protein
MAVVLVCASLSAAGALSCRALRRAAYADAVRGERAYRQWYDEGRVTPDRYLQVSERLMWARVALDRDRAVRSVAIAEHLRRSYRILRLEQDDLENCGRGGCANVAEVRQYIEDLEARLGVPPGPPASAE